jgi:hypothetical protein
MSLFIRNSPYYHLKYILLLKHPVYIYDVYIMRIIYIFNAREIWTYILLASYTHKVPDILASP